MAKGMKTGGRKPGTPNKRTVKYCDTLARLNFDAAEEAVKLFQTPELDMDMKLKVLEMITAYSQSKPKESVTDESALKDEPVADAPEVSTNDLLQLVSKK